ncbi:MAG TPA: plasmid segregation protein ParM [Brevibacillus sp.]|nr:plasmid segregation protein ParM [Brevibacillus sp.]
MIVLGIDHGNGNVKGYSAEKSLLLPSAYARPEDFSEEGLAKKELDLHQYSSAKFEGETYLWGKDVLEASKLITTYAAQNRYAEKSYRLLSEFAIASLLPSGQGNTFDNVMLVTGCPSREKGTKSEENLKNVFAGGHVVKVDGRDLVIHVTSVVVLPQPLGTVASLYLDVQGYVLDDSYEESYVAVIDIGSGTTDIDGIKALNRQIEDTDTIPMGMFDAYQKIADYVNDQMPEALATPDKVERQILNGSDSYKVSQRASVDITDIKSKAFRELAEDLTNGINKRWKNRAKFDKLLLTGGGAKPLADHFKNWDKDVIVVENAQQANAAGFYRYGVMMARG